MRLISIQDDGNIALTKDLVSGIPPYTILSHTWGDDDEEVTLQNLREGTAFCKKGYQKIEFCRKQTISDGLRHFWVDTCCIDKANHTELSEAINSMFKWYQNAEYCYVYLSDVHNYQSTDASWTEDFIGSRWFTRGWTLQELIAPPVVQFFSSGSQLLGSKTFLQDLIHSITGIDIRALLGADLAEFHVDEKISWSRNRKTKREEDVAYSLLGILDVHMPLIYGEGKQNSMRRLRREIQMRQIFARSERHNTRDLQHVSQHVARKHVNVPWYVNQNGSEFNGHYELDHQSSLQQGNVINL